MSDSISPKPVLVITGFLGAGKTTLLNKIMQSNPDLRLALIINEFGSIGLDSSLIKTPGEFVEMNNGCLCCALNEDLVQTLTTLKHRDDYEAIVLETSGIADPLTIAWTFLRPQFDIAFAIHALLAVVDPVLFQLKEDHPLMIEQIRACNIVYLSKTSFINQNEISSLKSEIMKINPQVRFFDSAESIRPLLLSHLEINPTNSKKHRGYSSEAIDLSGIELTLEDMEDRFEAFGPEILRAKALFWDVSRKKSVAIHYVCGRITHEFLFKKPSSESLIIIK